MKKLLKDKKFNKFMSVLLTTAMIAMTFSIDSISARADETQPEEQQQTGQMDQEGLMGGIEEGSEEELLLEGESSPEEELLPEDELMPEEEIMPEEEPMEEETSENEGEPEGDSEEEEGIFEDSGDEFDEY